MIRFTALLLSFLFVSCATTSPRQPVMLQKLAAAGIDSRTYTKIQAGRVLDFGDIIGLTKDKIPDTVIVSYLKSTHAPYRFTDTQLEQLTNAGAGADLVNYLGKSIGYYEATKRSQTGSSKWDRHPYFSDPYFWGPAPFPYAFPAEWSDPDAVGMIF